MSQLRFDFSVEIMERAEVVENSRGALLRAGFEVSHLCQVRSSCFDFVARKEKKLIFIKSFQNLRDVSREIASTIKEIASILQGYSLFISDFNNEEAIKNDTVYSRYGVFVVSPKTLEDILVGSFPLIEATPGGYCVKMKGQKILQRRHELALSIGKVAEMTGVSKRTLYNYERDITRASVSAAYRLEEVLGVPLAKTIDIFKLKPQSPISNNYSVNCKNSDQYLPNSIQKMMSRLNLDVSTFVRSPFDFIAFCSQKGYKILGGIFSNEENKTEDRIEEIISVCSITHAKPLILAQEGSLTHEEATFIAYDELETITGRKDLGLTN